MVDNNSNLYNLHFVQSGANVDTGSTSLNFLPDTISLSVTDTVVVSGPFGSDTVGVANSFVEGDPAPVPELTTWEMMALGFAGLGFAGYRNSRNNALIAA